MSKHLAANSTQQNQFLSSPLHSSLPLKVNHSNEGQELEVSPHLPYISR